MEMTKKETGTGGKPYARKEEYEYEGTTYAADIQAGDTVKILDEGTVETGDYGEQTVFTIETRNGEKRANFNQKSINALIDSFGSDSKEWVGKDVKVLINKTVIGGKKRVVAYFVTPDWSLDEFGDLVQDEGKAKDTEEINPDDIPF